MCSSTLPVPAATGGGVMLQGNECGGTSKSAGFKNSMPYVG